MSKECHNCNFKVKESHKGPCPNCNEEKGYHFFRSIKEEINISDMVKADLKKDGLDPNQILKTSKMLKTKKYGNPGDHTEPISKAGTI